MNKRAHLFTTGAFVVLAGAITAVSCNGPGSPGAQDTPTSGNVSVGVDETFAPILQAQIDTFSKLYPNAHVKMSFQPEEKVMVDLINDQVKLAVVSRELNAEETADFAKQKITPRITRIGIDGLAIVLNRANPDSLLTVAQLADIFTGKTSNWSQVSGKKGLAAINVVFDANRSSTTRFIRDSVTRGAALTPRVFAAASNPALLDYVASHPNAIGVVGVNWISDRDDPTAMKFARKVRVASITSRPNPRPDDYIQPYQVYLAEKTPEQLAEHPELQNYPLRRNLYIISREARAGLGTGFASFVAGKNGQLIFQKSGLLPAQMQARIVTTPKL
ncbi:PstS family phosphate ABC transporter substrate-binding protein [Hymenobacter properus]|uniref:Substrate-binding domain-containing protein n=1 Tax=Hymenobacter properus TaxID=2791026 RepID=A0A931BHQ1_9BACT|nr:substrate-binding domain-containing protein [Hymenobacter properus]MBF9142487.1 substrate-binding domain-containing protein [Hymenobacter properus]MBR7721294.1 substrate-binding domain-containing protein [Microvirga sp. SRT04]